MVHTEDRVDPVADLEIIHHELRQKDIERMEKVAEGLGKVPLVRGHSNPQVSCEGGYLRVPLDDMSPAMRRMEATDQAKAQTPRLMMHEVLVASNCHGHFGEVYRNCDASVHHAPIASVGSCYCHR